MSNRISLDQIQETLTKFNIEPDKKVKVLTELQAIIKEEKENKEPAIKIKNEFGVILYSDNPEVQKMEFTASIYQIKLGDTHDNILERISAAIKESNENCKKKNNIIDSIGGAFQNLKRRFIKEKGINLKSKEVVRVLISNNKVL